MNRGFTPFASDVGESFEGPPTVAPMASDSCSASRRARETASAPAHRPAAHPSHKVARVPRFSSAKNVETAEPNTAPKVFEPYRMPSDPRDLSSEEITARTAAGSVPPIRKAG